MGTFNDVNEPKWLCRVLALSLLPAAIVAAGEADRRYVQSGEGEQAVPIVAVDNVCAWPNLTVLRDRQRGHYRIWYGAWRDDKSTVRSHLATMTSGYDGVGGSYDFDDQRRGDEQARRRE